MNDLISRQAAIDAVEYGITYAKAINKITGEEKELFKEGNKALKEAIERLKGLRLPSAQQEQKSCKTCHLWEDGELNIACPWGSNYEHYEDDYCSLWEKQN